MKQSIKIGFEAKRLFHNKTGLGNYCRNLVCQLSEFYPENKYYLYNPQKKRKELFKPNNVNVLEKNPNSKLNKYFFNYWRQFSITNDLNIDKIDIFHGLSGEIPFGLKQNKIKSVVTIHDLIFMIYPEFYNFFDRKLHYYKFKKSCNQSDHIIAITEQTKNDIIKFFDVNPKKISVIYQGCNNAFKIKYSEIQKKQISLKYNLPEKFVLNVGTIEERKNIFEAVKAIKETDIQLVIIGKKTKYSANIENYIIENNMQNQVFFLNGISIIELAIIYQLATIFIYPSLYEGFGIPIIEALFSKTPVITSNRSCLPEAGGPDSIYVNPENSEDIKTALLSLWKDKPKREAIIDKGFNFVQKFNDEVIAKNIMELYNKILTEHL